MTYTRLYPKLLQSRSTEQLKISSEITARNNRTIQQEKRLKTKINNHYKERAKKFSVASKVDTFLLKTASPK